MDGVISAARPLFLATILAGSFLLFMVQPMVARMALPLLGGAPNVWNSAMLVYQALLLAGYAYAHGLSRLGLRRQIKVHLALLALAGLTLPIALARLAPPAAGWEVLWVPALLVATVGPVFLVVSAQAPLMQRWYAADPRSGAPWALYAASNLGSFAGLIAYPLLVEPLLSIHAQSLAWSLGYGLLVVLVAASARTRWNADELQPARTMVPESGSAAAEAEAPVTRGQILLWLALSAVPSGLLLSTTTHLTTDIVAMPLLWVIPLGLYLLSFAVAFADGRRVANAVILIAPPVVLFAGSYAMSSVSSGTMTVAVGALILLFVVSTALHARLYDSRPAAGKLTLFYLVMSAGGALGGAFTALAAPMLFDWVWEHPILILAAALLLPLSRRLDWPAVGGVDRGLSHIAVAVLLVGAVLAAVQLRVLVSDGAEGLFSAFVLTLLTGIGVLLAPWRWAFALVLMLGMLALGGITTFGASLHDQRLRSYFGIYTVYDDPHEQTRLLTHGTTLHGKQSLEPGRSHEPTTYYGDTSGVGLALEAAPALYGPAARVGLVGLGAGTLACRHKAGQTWTFFEIDPVILRYSRPKSGEPAFTFLRDCAPDARLELGDARIELAKGPARRFDVLVVDAFSSDAIPLHLLTDEAFAVYERALAPNGLLVVHISNRYIELEPILSAIAEKRGLSARIRDDYPSGGLTVASSWVALSRDEERLARLQAQDPGLEWKRLMPARRGADSAWTDDHASILPYIRWQNILGKP